MNPETLAPGPIVLHGGFTSAFYEFGDDQLGTGRLIISVACWLTRIEDRLYKAKRISKSIQTTIPKLSGSYQVTGSFSFWRSSHSTSGLRHSILILDGSGSMEDYYSQLLNSANKYINIQKSRGGLISVIAFSDIASILFERENRNLYSNEGYRGRNTNYLDALKCAITVASSNPSGYNCRILFFTDGEPNSENYSNELSRLRFMDVQIDAIGFGNQCNDRILQGLLHRGQISHGNTMNEIDEIFVRIAATE